MEGAGVVAVATGYSSYGTDQLLIECKDVKDADLIRGQLLSWNSRDYWFFVFKDGTITVANNFGGKLSQESLNAVKEKAKELMFNLSGSKTIE